MSGAAIVVAMILIWGRVTMRKDGPDAKSSFETDARNEGMRIARPGVDVRNNSTLAAGQQIRPDDGIGPQDEEIRRKERDAELLLALARKVESNPEIGTLGEHLASVQKQIDDLDADLWKLKDVLNRKQAVYENVETAPAEFRPFFKLVKDRETLGRIADSIRLRIRQELVEP